METKGQLETWFRQLEAQPAAAFADIGVAARQ